MSQEIQTIKEKITPILKQAGVFGAAKKYSLKNFNTLHLEDLAKKYNLKFIILHGSYAMGKQHKNSDVDIAVVGKEELAFKQLLQLNGEMAEEIGLPPQADLDLKTLNKVDPLFRYEVTRDGKLLYGNEADYEDFKAFSLRAFEDARPLFDLERLLVNKFQTHLNALYVK